MNKAFLFTLVVNVIVTCSCSKDDPVKTTGRPRLETVSTYNSSGVLANIDSVKYDKQGRQIYISNKTFYNNTFIFIQTYYNYTGSSVTSDMYSNGAKTRSVVYPLNSAGLCTGYVAADSDNKFYYNSDKYVIGKNITLPTTVMEFSYIIENGNTIKSTGIMTENSGNITESLSTYDYYFDKINTIGNENKGLDWCGKQDKNLRKSYTYNGKTIGYTYIFDAKDRVVKQTYSTGEYLVFTYY